MPLKLGTKTRSQLAHLAQVWRQGEHVLVIGRTGSGKTRLARELVDIRLRAGGSVVVLMAKLQPDSTITDDYLAKGFVRWKTWKKRPAQHERAIVLWPAVEGKSAMEANAIFKREFSHALNEVSKIGKWTVVIDEGLMMCSPAYFNLGSEVGMMHALMRSAKGTLITCAQRPAHLPLSVYANVSHAFVGRAQEAADLKRLAHLDGTSQRQMNELTRDYGVHDFLWVPAGAPQIPSQRVNLTE